MLTFSFKLKKLPFSHLKIFTLAVKVHTNPRSNLCTGAIIRDTGSGVVDGQYQLKYDTQGEQGTPCYGDRGTSLMFKEKERYS